MTGRYIYSVGGNRNAAGLTGVNTKKVDFLVMVNMGLLAGVAGMVFTAYLNASNPKDGVGFELDAIAAVFIGGAAVAGGVGTVTGAMIGGLVMGVLNLGLANMSVDSNWIQVIKGLVLLGAVAFDVLSKKAGGRRSFVSMVMDAFTGSRGKDGTLANPGAAPGLNPDAEGVGAAITGASVEDVDEAAHAIHVDEVGPGGTRPAQLAATTSPTPSAPRCPCRRGALACPPGEQDGPARGCDRMTPTADATISALRSTHDELAAVVRDLVRRAAARTLGRLRVAGGPGALAPRQRRRDRPGHAARRDRARARRSATASTSRSGTAGTRCPRASRPTPSSTPTPRWWRPTRR